MEEEYGMDMAWDQYEMRGQKEWNEYPEGDTVPTPTTVPKEQEERRQRPNPRPEQEEDGNEWEGGLQGQRGEDRKGGHRGHPAAKEHKNFPPTAPPRRNPPDNHPHSAEDRGEGGRVGGSEAPPDGRRRNNKPQGMEQRDQHGEQGTRGNRDERGNWFEERRHQGRAQHIQNGGSTRTWEGEVEGWYGDGGRGRNRRPRTEQQAAAAPHSGEEGQGDPRRHDGPPGRNRRQAEPSNGPDYYTSRADQTPPPSGDEVDHQTRPARHSRTGKATGTDTGTKRPTRQSRHQDETDTYCESCRNRENTPGQRRGRNRPLYRTSRRRDSSSSESTTSDSSSSSDGTIRDRGNRAAPPNRGNQDRKGQEHSSSRSAQGEEVGVRRSSVKPKVPKFSGGTSQEFQEFQVKFDLMANSQDWNEEEKLDHLLQQALSGNAFRLVELERKKGNLDYEKAMSKLRKRYYRQVHKDLQRRQLGSLRQEPGQSIQDFADVIERETALAFRGDGTATRKTMVDQFLKGLANSHVKSLTALAKPKSLRQALRQALDSEAHVFLYQDGKPIRAAQAEPAQATTSPCPQCHEIGCPGTTQAEECRRRNVICFNCEKIGHVRTYCPNPRRARSPSPGGRGRAQSPRSRNDACFRCGGTGHFARECPNPPAAGFRGTPRNSPGNSPARPATTPSGEE